MGEEEDSHLGDFIEDRNALPPADAASKQLLKEQIDEVERRYKNPVNLIEAIGESRNSEQIDLIERQREKSALEALKKAKASEDYSTAQSALDRRLAELRTL